MTTDNPRYVTTVDRWGHLADAQFATRDEWTKALPRLRAIDRRLHLEVLTEGLAAAADENGLLLRFLLHKFYAGPLSDVMRNDEDPAGWSLTYDRFTAMALTDAKYSLLQAGWLATRGNGDSVDYRLTIPASDGTR